MKRVDAEDFGARVQSPGPLFVEERADGPFAGSKVVPSADERVVAGMIWRHKGRADPILREKIMAATGLPERAVKGIVAELVVTHRLRIAGSRGDPAGYFMVVDLEDQAVAVGPFREQIFSMWRRLRVLMDKHALAEMAGQLAMEAGQAEVCPTEEVKR